MEKENKKEDNASSQMLIAGKTLKPHNSRRLNQIKRKNGVCLNQNRVLSLRKGSALGLFLFLLLVFNICLVLQYLLVLGISFYFLVNSKN